jgi:hypothetical protein
MQSDDSTVTIVETVGGGAGIVETVDGKVLTDRQQEFAGRVGAKSALSGSNGSVFLYREDSHCAVRWQISPAGHPVTIDFLF